jgi:acetyl esterase/lipase
VPANKIVFAGDSAGGGLSLALLQTLLTLRRINPNRTIRFHGKDVPIELPAGLALNSPWCDVTRSLPSTFENAAYDYLIPPPQEPGTVYAPIPFPTDGIWPSSPPRVDMYANASALAHPLVSPLAGPKEIWRDTPPIFIAVGQESLEDDSIYLSRKIHRVGGTVVLHRFDGMPHCFALMVRGTAVSRRCFGAWAEFCVDAVHDRVQRTGSAEYVHHSGAHCEKKSLEELGKLSDEEVEKIVKAGKDWRFQGEMELVDKWTKERAKL